MKESIEQEIDDFRHELRRLIETRRFELREIDRLAEWQPNYLSQVLRGQIKLRIEHVLTILDVLDIEPADFFASFYSMSAEERRQAYKAGLSGVQLGDLMGYIDEAVERVFEQRIKDKKTGKTA